MNRELSIHAYIRWLLISWVSNRFRTDKLEGVFSGVRRAIPWELGSLNMETVQIQELIGNWNKNGLVHEDDYVNELLMTATAVAEKADERLNIDIEMCGDDEVSIQYRDVIYIH